MNIDTSSVAVYGKGTELFDFGYLRDKRPDLGQVNFGAAELRNPINIPFRLSVGKGNTSNSIQFVNIVDDIIGNLCDDSLFDAGGDVKQVLDCCITAKNMRYITRRGRLNKSDDIWISKFDKSGTYCVDEADGVHCRRRTF